MDKDSNFGRLGLLTVGLRRRMYDFIRERRGPVTRDEAAAAAGISRKLAAFHLDKLVNAGLLKAHYGRRAGRGGPGAGRPSKLYEPTDVELHVSVPDRRYDIPGEILLESLETRRADEDPRAAAERVAFRRGVDAGRASVHQAPSPALVAQEVLRGCGFEPYTDVDGTVRLNNCPFHRLAQRSPEMVCGMNRAFVAGLLEGVGDRHDRALLEPRPKECCVAIRRVGDVA